ncbi:hypothetical protein ACFE04_006713 [Oxalis oulophora]
MYGVVKIHSKQVEYLLEDINRVLSQVNNTFLVGTTHQTSPQRFRTTRLSITLPETFQLDAFDLQVEEHGDGGNVLPQEDITLKDTSGKTDPGKFIFDETSCPVLLFEFDLNPEIVEVSDIELEYTMLCNRVRIRGSTNEDKTNVYHNEAFADTFLADNNPLVIDVCSSYFMDMNVEPSSSGLGDLVERLQGLITEKCAVDEAISNSQIGMDIEGFNGCSRRFSEEEPQDPVESICNDNMVTDEPCTEDVSYKTESDTEMNDDIVDEDDNVITENHTETSIDNMVDIELTQQTAKLNSEMTKSKKRDRAYLGKALLHVTIDATPQTKLSDSAGACPKVTTVRRSTRLSRKEKSIMYDVPIIRAAEYKKWTKDPSNLVRSSRKKVPRTTLAAWKASKASNLPKLFSEPSIQNISPELSCLLTAKRFPALQSIRIVGGSSASDVSTPQTLDRSLERGVIAPDSVRKVAVLETPVWDDEYSIPSSNQPFMDTLSGMVANKLEKYFASENKGGEQAVEILPLVKKKTKKESANLFYEVLVLATKGCTKVKQVEAYGDITVSKLPKWDSLLN